MTSLSTRFLGQPRLINPIFVMKRSLAFHCSLFLWERVGRGLVGAHSPILIPSPSPRGRKEEEKVLPQRPLRFNSAPGFVQAEAIATRFAFVPSRITVLS